MRGLEYRAMSLEVIADRVADENDAGELYSDLLSRIGDEELRKAIDTCVGVRICATEAMGYAKALAGDDLDTDWFSSRAAGHDDQLEDRLFLLEEQVSALLATVNTSGPAPPL